MPRYDVTLNEIEAKTYRVEADSPDEAIAVAKSLEDPKAHLVDVEWIDYWADAEEDDVVEVNEDTG